jgi:SARP family transcriptional regulator, regulator of embCAB operon
MNDSSVSIELLTGAVEVCGKRIEDLSPGRMALLVALARKRSVVARAVLLEDLWPEYDEPAALNAFNVCLFRLRRILVEESVIQERGGYRLSDGVRVDIWEIERFLAELRPKAILSQAEHRELRLLIARLVASRPPFYTAWVWFEATERRIEELLVEAGQRLAQEALREGRPFDALELAHSIIERDPCDEPAREIAIRAYLAAGDEPSAFREYRRYRAALAQELGVEPSRSLRQILTGSYDLTTA